MFGLKLKLWMETHLGKSRRRGKSLSCEEDNGDRIGGGSAHRALSSSTTTRSCRRESKTDEEPGTVSASASTSTSILLSGGGSFTQSLSSPDTGYSTDGYSPKNGYPALSSKSSSYALSSLLSMHLFKRNSPPICEEFPVSVVSPESKAKTPAVAVVQENPPITPVRKASLAKEESTASPLPRISRQGSSPLDTTTRNELGPATKARTRIKTNPWLSMPVPVKDKITTAAAGISDSEISKFPPPPASGIPELHRMSASTDSGQGTLDNQERRDLAEYPSSRNPFLPSSGHEMNYPEIRSTTSTATNTPISNRIRIPSHEKIVPRHSSLSEPKSEDGTTLIDLMGRFDEGEGSYQKMVDKETDILSDWANTDEDVDEDLLTPRGPSPENISCTNPNIPPLPPYSLVNMTASPRSFAPSMPREINFNLPTNTTNCFDPPTTILPEAYDTLVLAGKSNLTGISRCTTAAAFSPPLKAYPPEYINRKKIIHSQSSRSTSTSKIARGALGLLRKLFRKPLAGAGRRDRVRDPGVSGLPDCSFPPPICNRLLPCSPAPSKSFLTPTPNSFRRKTTEDSRPSSVQKGVKIDVIRVPSLDSGVIDPVTPLFNAKWAGASPIPQPASGLEYMSPHFETRARQSPYFSNRGSPTPSPATFGMIRNGLIGPPIPERSPLLISNCGRSQGQSRVPCDPPRFSKNRLTSPSFNNYSPIHRLVVTSHSHGVPRGNIRSESVRSSPRPLPPTSSPLCVHHSPNSNYCSRQSPNSNFCSRQSPNFSSRQIFQNPSFQYITSSNASSPLLSNFKRAAPAPPPPPHQTRATATGTGPPPPLPPLRGIIKTTTTHSHSAINGHGHYYSTPQKKSMTNTGPKVTGICPSGNYSTANGDRIYERVDGLDNSDDGDGEGGDYECDLSLASSSQPSQSVSQERPVAVVPEKDRERKVHWPMSWGTALSETESRILEADVDQKYRRLIWQAEALLQEIALESNAVAAAAVGSHDQQRRNRGGSRFQPEDCPQSDPLQRKTYDCWALRRLQQELAGCCASPPVLHRSRVHLSPAIHDPIPMVTHIPLVRNHSFLRRE